MTVAGEVLVCQCLARLRVSVCVCACFRAWGALVGACVCFGVGGKDAIGGIFVSYLQFIFCLIIILSLSIYIFINLTISVHRSRSSSSPLSSSPDNLLQERPFPLYSISTYHFCGDKFLSHRTT